MNKMDFQKSLWVDVTKRLPPFRDVLDIALFNPELGFVSVVTANEAWNFGMQIRKGKIKQLPWEYQYSHWMTVAPPEGYNSRIQKICEVDKKQAEYYKQKLVDEIL